MALTLYVMPITGAGTRQDSRRPKYATTIQSFGWGMFDYGDEPVCLTGIVNIDAATHNALMANADVRTIPPAGLSFDATLTAGQRTTVQNDLEAFNIPGTWVTTANTWRDVLEFVGAVCQYAQRYQGGACGGRWFTGGVTLDTTLGSLPATIRQCLLDAASSFGFDTSGITGTSTLRQVIRSAGQQYVSVRLPLLLGGVDLYTA